MVDHLVNSKANARRIARIENSFGCSGQPLAVDGRILLAEGVLMKVCRKKNKPRKFFLFNDILIYAHIVIDNKIYNKQHIIPLVEIKIEDAEDCELKNSWFIRTPCKSFAVYAPNLEDKVKWMTSINNCVEKLNKTEKQPHIEFAPVLIPNYLVSACMLCNTQFRGLKKKHHCRNCGSVICNSCSKKFLLAAQSSKPVRVCRDCHENLMNKSFSEVSVNIESSGNECSKSEDDVSTGFSSWAADYLDRFYIDEDKKYVPKYIVDSRISSGEVVEEICMEESLNLCEVHEKQSSSHLNATKSEP